jgi:hypothetical protein
MRSPRSTTNFAAENGVLLAGSKGTALTLAFAGALYSVVGDEDDRANDWGMSASAKPSTAIAAAFSDSSCFAINRGVESIQRIVLAALCRNPYEKPRKSSS